jgi:hypothetical protein
MLDCIPALKDVFWLVPRETCGCHYMGGRMDKEHIRSGLELLLREAFREEEKGDEEGGVGLPVDHMEGYLVCDHLIEVFGQSRR